MEGFCPLWSRDGTETESGWTLLDRSTEGGGLKSGHGYVFLSGTRRHGRNVGAPVPVS